jgi:regulator of replication initiation timing
MKHYNVHEALKILQQYYITECIQMVTRWIRERKIIAERSHNKKDGWKIHEDDLFEFIEDKRPGLRQVMAVYEEYMNGLNVQQDGNSRPTLVNSVEVESKEKINPNVREEILTLESMVEQLQDEISQVRENLLEVMSQNHKLEEENKILHELYEMMDQEIGVIKCSRPVVSNAIEVIKEEKPVDSEPTKTMKIPFEQFKKIADEILGESVYNLEPEETYLKLGNLYNNICSEDGSVKEELVTQEGIINCPFTKKEFKQKKRFVKSIVKYVFEDQIKEDEDMVT